MDSELKLRKVKLQLHHRKSEGKQPRLGRACKKENSGPEGRPDRHQHIENILQLSYSYIYIYGETIVYLNPNKSF